MKIKYIIFAIAALLITGIALGFYFYNKPAATTVSGEPDVKVSAVDLYNKVVENADTAEKTYKNKNIEVTGAVRKIENSTFGPILYLDVMNEYSSVQCKFDLKHKDEISNVQEGDNVNVFGQFNGINANDLIPEMVDISLSKCTLVKN